MVRRVICTTRPKTREKVGKQKEGHAASESSTSLCPPALERGPHENRVLYWGFLHARGKNESTFECNILTIGTPGCLWSAYPNGLSSATLLCLTHHLNRVRSGEDPHLPCCVHICWSTTIYLLAADSATQDMFSKPLGIHICIKSLSVSNLFVYAR